MNHTITNRSVWQRSLLFLGAAATVCFLLFRETWLSMWDVWSSSETYAHGFLIIPISLFLVWRLRSELARQTPLTDWLGHFALAGSGLLWLAGWLADANVVQHFAVVSMLLSLCVAILGRRTTWVMAFPLGYMYLAVPFGDSLIAPLQDFTAFFTVYGLELTGIPVYLEGRIISIPTGEFEVAEACSGTRYLIASVAVGALYAYLTYRSWWRRVAFIGIAILVPIIANGFRAYGIVMLAHLSDMKIAVGVDHLVYGWIFFGLVVLLMFWIGGKWREPDAARDDLAFVPTDSVPGSAVRQLGGAGAAIVLLAMPSLAANLGAAAVPSGGSVQLAAPGPLGWSSVEPASSYWRPVYKGASQTLMRSYRTEAGKHVDLFVAYYPSQGQNRELIGFGNRLYDSEVWAQTGSRDFSLEGGGTGEWPIKELSLDGRNRERLVWFWYEVGSERTTSELYAKALSMFQKLGLTEGSALVALSAEYHLDPSEARLALEEFLTWADLSLAAMLEASNDSAPVARVQSESLLQ